MIPSSVAPEKVLSVRMDISPFLTNYSVISLTVLVAIPALSIIGWAIWVKKESIRAKNLAGAFFFASISCLLLLPALVNTHHGFVKENMSTALQQAYGITFENRALDDIRSAGSGNTISVIGAKGGREQVIRASVQDGQLLLSEQDGDEYVEIEPRQL